MWNNLNKTIKDNNIEWLCIKIPFVVFCCFVLKYSLESATSIGTSRGLCYLLNCNLFLISSVKIFFLVLIVILSVLYILERKMLFVSFLMFLLCFIVFSAHESFGVQDRTGIVTLIWLVQFLSYFFKWKKPNFDLNRNRIYFSVQVIVACYTLSALSKLYVSGFSWVLNTQLIVLQMLKSNQTSYLDGWILLTDVVSPKITFVLENSKTVSFLLFCALMIELTSGLGLINKKIRIIYGFLILLLHFGIYYFFGIVIFSFAVSMIFFMINPFYLIYLLVQKITKVQRKIS
jgi:hypothetical protein